jgi:hypothetical protein
MVRAGLDAKLIVVHGAGHGGGAFFGAERTSLVAAFLDEHLRRNLASDASEAESSVSQPRSRTGARRRRSTRR